MTYFSNLSVAAEAATKPFEAGDLAVNFGQTVRVVEVRHDGLLVVQQIGLDTSAPGWGDRWLASPDKTSHAL